MEHTLVFPIMLEIPASKPPIPSEFQLQVSLHAFGIRVQGTPSPCPKTSLTQSVVYCIYLIKRLPRLNAALE